MYLPVAIFSVAEATDCGFISVLGRSERVANED